MAHAGKDYPVEQTFRYLHGAVQWPFFLPMVYLCKVNHWTGGPLLPPDDEVVECLPTGWAPGATGVEYRGASPSNPLIEVGIQFRWSGTFNSEFQFAFQFWYAGVEQYDPYNPYSFNLFALRGLIYTSGQLVRIGTAPAYIATSVNVKAQRWDGGGGPFF